MSESPTLAASKISVIVPVYRVEKYLAKCIESMIRQTFRNLEIILVNDGSPDRCGEICDTYAAADSRIQVIHQPNGGPSVARNTGLDAATGAYISFIDPDDSIHETYYETMMKLIAEHDADLAQCHFQMVYEDGREADKKTGQAHAAPAKETVSLLTNREALHHLYTNDFAYVNACVVWNKLYKRALFDRIRFPAGKIHEDEHIIYKVFYRAGKIVFTDKPLYFYLQRPESYMGRNFHIKRLEVLDAYYEQIHFYREKKLYDLERKAKINFEGTIRNIMNKVLLSNMEQKDQVFEILLTYYRKHYPLFARDLQNIGLKKVIMVLFRHSSKSMIKLLLRLKYYKSLLT